MKVFISWSGGRSKRVAQALRIFLQDVNHNIVPWLSEADIAAGSRWRDDLAKELEQTTFGIICLTPEAATSPWLLFEAGALSKSVQNSRVCPYLIGMEPKNLEGPLSQFQSKLADSNGTFELLADINKAMTHGSLTEDRIKRYFNTFWPDLESVVRETSSNTTESSRGRRGVVWDHLGIFQNTLANLDNVHRKTREQAVKMLVSMQHPAARDAVVNALKHPMSDVREAAARAVGEIKDPAAVPALIEALRDNGSGVRVAAARAIGEIKDPAAVPALIEALHDNISKVCEAAGRALGEIKDRAAVPALIEALRNGDIDVREAAARALGEIKDPAAIPALIEALRDNSSGVRVAAARALGEIKDPAAVPALIEALHDNSGGVRVAAAQALVGHPLGPALIDDLGNENPYRDSNVRVWAVAQVLVEIKDPAAVPALIEVLRNGNSDLRKAAARALVEMKDPAAVPALIEALRDNVVRLRAARVLVEIKDPAVVRSLIEALRDNVSNVREMAARALGEIKDSAAVPALIEALRDNSNVRAAAVRALGEIKDPAAVPALTKIRHDDVMREAAVAAIVKINKRTG